MGRYTSGSSGGGGGGVALGQILQTLSASFDIGFDANGRVTVDGATFTDGNWQESTSLAAFAKTLPTRRSPMATGMTDTGRRSVLGGIDCTILTNTIRATVKRGNTLVSLLLKNTSQLTGWFQAASTQNPAPNICYSNDDGATWANCAFTGMGLFVPQTVTFNDLRYADGKYVAIVNLNLSQSGLVNQGSGANLAVSSDGVTFDLRTIVSGGKIHALEYVPTLAKWFAIVYDNTQPVQQESRLYSTTDLSNWTFVSTIPVSAPNHFITNLVWAKSAGLLVASTSTNGSNAGYVLTSPNGSGWTARSITHPTSTGVYSTFVLADDNYIYVSAANGNFSSTDGVTYTLRPYGPGGTSGSGTTNGQAQKGIVPGSESDPLGPICVGLSAELAKVESLGSTVTNYYRYEISLFRLRSGGLFRDELGVIRGVGRERIPAIGSGYTQSAMYAQANQFFPVPHAFSHSVSLDLLGSGAATFIGHRLDPSLVGLGVQSGSSFNVCVGRAPSLTQARSFRQDDYSRID